MSPHTADDLVLRLLDDNPASIGEIVNRLARNAPSCFAPDLEAIQRGLDELVLDGRAELVAGSGFPQFRKA